MILDIEFAELEQNFVFHEADESDFSADLDGVIIVGGVDLTGYATEDYVDKKIAEIQIGGGTSLTFDETLKVENGALSVNTTSIVDRDNTLPITSAGVYMAVGNIEALLNTI